MIFGRHSAVTILLALTVVLGATEFSAYAGKGAAGKVEAGRVDELCRALQSDPSFKVRVQAALLLGKLGERAAVDPLMKALGDENKSVRAMVAQSLGKLGDIRALPALKRLLDSETDGFVRTQAEAAMASLQDSDAKGKRILVTLGSFSGGAKTADSAVLALLRDSLKLSLSKLPQLGFMEGADAKGKGGGKPAFLVDGNVSRLDESPAGANIETHCEVKVMVARWPGRSIILWTSAGAAVQSGSRERDRQNARRDCIEASAGQLGDSLMGFFRSQGG